MMAEMVVKVTHCAMRTAQLVEAKPGEASIRQPAVAVLLGESPRTAKDDARVRMALYAAVQQSWSTGPTETEYQTPAHVPWQSSKPARLVSPRVADVHRQSDVQVPRLLGELQVQRIQQHYQVVVPQLLV